MACLLIREHEVEQLVGIVDAIESLRVMYQHWGEGNAKNLPRRRVQLDHMMLHGMSAGASYLGRVAWKQYTTTSSSARFYVGLYSQESGAWLALIEAEKLGQLRTGALTGLAIQKLGMDHLTKLGVIGCGKQAETQILAAAAVCPLTEITVHSRDPIHRQAFAEQMSRQLSKTVQSSDRPQLVVENSELVITATTSRQPVVQREWLSNCRMLVAMGSNSAARREFAPDALSLFETIVCDDIECCQAEAGELIAAEKEGLFHWEKAHSLHRFPPASDPTKIETQSDSNPSKCLFKSVGVAVADLALASLIFDRAVEQGKGISLPIS